MPNGPSSAANVWLRPTTPPFGCGIGRAQRVAEPSGGRRHVDDRPAAGSLEQRGGKPGAIELAGEIDGQRLLPRGDIEGFDRPRWPGDAGIVDERVEAAECGLRLREHSLDGGGIADIAEARRNAGKIRFQFCQRRGIDIAGVNPRTGIAKDSNDLAPRSRWRRPSPPRAGHQPAAA
jgi:hypothetical protein